MSIRCVCPTLRVMPERTSFWNPVASADTTYLPMGTAEIENAPAELLTNSRVKATSGLEIVTFAFGITAPLLSETVPTILAVSWHQAGIEISRQVAAKKSTTLFIRILRVEVSPGPPGDRPIDFLINLATDRE